MKIKNLFILPTITALLVSNSCVLNFESSHPSFEITEYHVADGDTIYFNDNGQKVGIRILGIDTPETKKKNNKVAKYENFFAQRAAQFMQNILKNKPINVRKLSSDKYGRWVCVVRNYQGIDVAKLLLGAGLARVKYISKTRSNFAYWVNDEWSQKYYDEIIKIQNDAKRSQKGFWIHNEKDVFWKK